MGVHPQLLDEHRREKENRRSESEREEVRDFVAVTKSLNQSTRPRIRAEPRAEVWWPLRSCYWIMRNRLQFLIDDGLRKLGVGQAFVVALSIGEHPLQEVLDCIAFRARPKSGPESTAR